MFGRMQAVLVLVAVVIAVGGVVAAVVVAVLVNRRLVAQMRQQAVAEREAAVKAALDHAVSLTGELGARELDARKGLIDQQLDAMGQQLGRVADVVGELERDRERKFGELTGQLQDATRVTAALSESTQRLREALASPKARGQWGERMAEDVLRLAGFVEGVNYEKQSTLDTGGRPDFTFPLPKGYVVHMDAKFPVASYLRCLEAATDGERGTHRSQFMRDVRQRVKELAGRDYIDPEGRTVDYVLLFIPNESIYGFIHESDPALLDDALRQKVVMCSPLSLFAVLAVIRQAFDNFVLEQTSNEILALLGAFGAQYGRFCDQLDKLGRGLGTVSKAFEDLMGTRRRALERPLERIEALRREKGIAAAGVTGMLEIAELPEERAV